MLVSCQCLLCSHDTLVLSGSLAPATARGTDKKINYARSYTAASFAQRLSVACVMYGAESILGALKNARGARLQGAAP